MGRQRIIIWVTTGLAALAVAMGLWLALWPSSGKIQSSSPVDGATIQESVQVQTASTSSKPPSGGATETGRIQDGMEYIIRDASGNIKESKSVGGQ